MQLKSIPSLLVCLLICLSGGWITGLLTQSSVTSWYPTLIKPTWTPPNFLFPIVWTILYTMMTVSLWLLWQSPAQNKRLAYSAFAMQLAFNFSWSWLFFYCQNPFYGLVDLSLLWLATLVCIITFRRYSRFASYFLVPYLAWITYAWLLNLFIWQYNQ